MPFQVISAVRPCAKPASIRTLVGSVEVGQNIDEGDVPDGTAIADAVRYVVHGMPSDGTIGYNRATYGIGKAFEGVSAVTAFTRSGDDVRLIRTQGGAVSETGIEDAYYIVSGNSITDTIVYPDSSAGVRYTIGDVFKGTAGQEFVKDKYIDVGDTDDIQDGVMYFVTGTPAEGTITYPTQAQGDALQPPVSPVTYSPGEAFTGIDGATDFGRSAATVKVSRLAVEGTSDDDDSGITNNVALYKIADSQVIETLTRHKLGAVAIPNMQGLDFSGSVGAMGDRVGAAIPADNVERVYIWNLGTSSATVWFRSFIPEFDNEIGASRRDVDISIPAGQIAWCWLPTGLFQQQSNNSRFSPADSADDSAEEIAAKEADRQASLNAFIIQTDSTNIWVKPESGTYLGVQ